VRALGQREDLRRGRVRGGQGIRAGSRRPVTGRPGRAEIIPGPEVCLVGAIGSVVLANLLPVRRCSRAKARSRKNTTSKYVVNTGKYPHNAQTYTFTARVEIMEKGLTARPRR
jgi:hypothetical protein